MSKKSNKNGEGRLIGFGMLLQVLEVLLGFIFH